MLLKDNSNGKVKWATGFRKYLYSAGIGYIWERQGVVDNPNCFIRFFTSLLGIMECTCMLFTFENGVPLMR